MAVYRLLLRLYPASFRGEYANDMRAIFARRLADARGVGVIAVWLEAIADSVVSAAAAHWDILRADLRYARRTFSRARGFAVMAVVIIALGIGATTAAFSITDFVLIRPLPFPHADRLVKIWERHPGFDRMQLSPSNYRDLKRTALSFENWGAYRGLALNLVGSGEPERVQGAVVTADVIPTLGIAPVVGRTFAADDEREGAAATVMLSYRLWQTHFGGDDRAIGTTVLLDGRPYSVIGVMPASFFFPNRDAVLWTAMRLDQEDFVDRNDNYLEAVGRLRSGATPASARAELAVAASQLRMSYPKENAHTDFSVIDIRGEIASSVRMALLTLSGAALCVLLIACANLANLLLARGVARSRELAVRSAMGAGRERLVRQLFTESLLLAAVGGVLGVALGWSAVPLLSRLVPIRLPVAGVPSVDLRVLAFAALATAGVGVLFGLAPVWGARGAADASALRATARSGGGRRDHLRSALVVVEVIASVVLLVAVGLLLKALWRVQAVDFGFRSEGVLTLRTPLPTPKYNAVADRDVFYARVLDGVRALPGVTAAAYVSFVPIAGGGGIFPVGVNGAEPTDRTLANVASLRYVTPGYFATMGMPLRRGRDVTDADTADRGSVAVVSESFVKRFFPDRDPIGRRFHFAYGDREIVGVVGDVRDWGPEQQSAPQVYCAYRQMDDGKFTWYSPKDLIVRTSGSPTELTPSIRAIVRSADPTQPIAAVQTLSAIVDGETAPREAQLSVLGAFAILAFVLAAIGIHAVLSFAVSQRAQEIGVRVALGAEPHDILGMIAGRSVALVAAGLVPGLAVAYAAGRSMEALLAGVTPADPATFAVAVAIVVVMTIVGTVVPAVRALRVNPIDALKAE